MSDTKFTKGEWKLERGRYDSYLIEHVNEELTTDLLATVHDLNRVAREDEVKANVNLFLAAPDLYAALENALGLLFLEGAAGGGIGDQARAALAKARGEP
jgi:hypothetical protein